MKTDAQVQHDVMAELTWEPSVHAARIGVEVDDGVVTLAGQVNSYSEKWNAERAAQRVSGVRAMTTELMVQLPGIGQRSDSDIAHSVKNVLEWNSVLPADAIKVRVETGWVTLSGDVDWQYQKRAAVASIRTLMGVVGVNDEILIKPSVNVFAVKADIEAALKRSATADAKKISVTIDGTGVTLSGTAHSWAERETATQAAWSTPGVRSVVDKITLVY